MKKVVIGVIIALISALIPAMELSADYPKSITPQGLAKLRQCSCLPGKRAGVVCPADWQSDWELFATHHGLCTCNARFFADSLTYAPEIIFPIDQYSYFHKKYGNRTCWDYYQALYPSSAEMRYPCAWNYGLAKRLGLAQLVADGHYDRAHERINQQLAQAANRDTKNSLLWWSKDIERIKTAKEGGLS